MARAQARRLKLHLRVAASASLVLAVLAGLIGFAQSASAHSLSLAGVASCQEDGTFLITWTLTNDYGLDSVVHSFTVSPTVGTTDLTADAGYHGGTPYEGSGTVVPANKAIQFTTTGIPGDTPAVTLGVAGTWTDGYMQPNPPSATVPLTGDCFGTLEITKHVTGQSAPPPGTTYTIAYDNGHGTSGTVQVKAGQTVTVTKLPFGTYVLHEVSPPAGDTVTITPSTVTVAPTAKVALVSVTNTFPDLGGFTVTKHVTGQTAGYVPGSQFTVSYSCSNDTSGTLTLIDGATKGVGSLPIGTTCNLSETAKPPTVDASYVYGQEIWTPSDMVTIVANDSDNTVAVTLDNPITRVEGGFTVTKHVTGETAGYVAGSDFTVSYTCSNGTSGTLTLADGDTGAVSGLPLLTTCTLAETGKPATKDGSYIWGTETWDPSNTVTIVANSSNDVVSVVLTNPLQRVLGGFTVTKQVTGATAGYVAGSTFTVTYTCSDHSTGTLVLTNGASKSVGSLPLGTTCTLSETGRPATSGAGFTWGTPVWSPSNVVTIAANDTDNHVSVTLKNPLTQVLGTAVTPPPTTVQAATLPRTGAPDTIWLLVIGFMLVIGGGCFVVATRIDD